MPVPPRLAALHDPPDPAARAAFGGKAAALAEAAAAGLPVPGGFVVPPGASLDGELDAALDRLSEGDPGVRFAVRSSGAEEDGAAHAFAGLFETFLGVPRARVRERIEAVRASGRSERVAAYRTARGLDGEAEKPAVLVQPMLAPEASGVAFSVDPVTGEAGVAVVAAVRGLASALVDGRATGETLRVDAAGHVLSRTSGEQATADVLAADGEGVEEVPVEETGPVLTDAEAAEVAALARRAATHFGRPQDVEWARADGRLWLLQSRPVTTVPAPAGVARLWDNSNIAESYGGVTTPLTYSFARRAYEEVYRGFFRLMGVPEARVEAHAETFAGMIGLVRGRVFYNLASWYRALALLPGYRTNARFMEGMMGVRDGIPADLRPDPPSGGRLADAAALARTALGLVAAAVRLPAMKRAFLDRLDRALALPPGGLDAMGYDALAAHYRGLEAALLRRWDAPLVNDFFAMIAFGLAQRTAERWVGPGALGPLLAGDGDVISAEPARRIRALAETAAREPALARTLRDGDETAVRESLAERPAFARDVAAYLARFGDRCLEELKLESPTLADDPAPLYRAVGALAVRLAEEDVPAPGLAEAAVRADGERQMRATLKGRPLRRLLFQWILKRARARVRDRENLRFERTRVFGRARRIALAMGARLAEAGRLDDARDVFYLEIPELLGVADGTGTTADLRGLARVRRAEFEGYRAAPAPPDRFRTAGAVGLSPLAGEVAPSPDAADMTGDVRTGLGCCPGVVEGPARVVRDPRGVTLAPGTILVAERTDPGWVLLFPSCAGLVVERGSLLSHSAIVARELGIPAAVAVPGATAWLRDGDRVRLDGRTGRVERLVPEPVAEPAAP